MHFLYPQDLLEPRLVDEMFRGEAAAVQGRGHSVSLMDSNIFTVIARTFHHASADSDSEVVYRGWMLAPAEYETLLGSLDRLGAKAKTSLERYLSAHYLPNWYPLLADLTPETVVLDPTDDLIGALTQLGWSRFFVKDYVKSLKTAGGSVIDRPEDIGRVVSEMKQFRGLIEGGLCVRRFEAFVPESERRFFVIDGECFAAQAEAATPPIVQECARRLRSPFFSVDIATRTDGAERLVEIGDGQVSDLVGWTADRFAALWSASILKP